MLRIFKKLGFRRSTAILPVVLAALGLLLSGCPQPVGSPVLYTITFDSHGGSAVAAITQNTGTSVAKPADPTRTGYTFTGWYSAENGGTLYSWPYTLTGNLTMHAQWQDAGQPAPTQYTITFDSHGGSAVTAITANAGTAVSKPVDPERTGYTFDGWYSVVSGGTLYSWPYDLTASVTMHARWRENSLPPPVQYTITFDSHGGSTVETITANTGTQVTKPIDPTQVGYTFTGWFSTETGGTAYTWPHALTDNVTMHAQWQDNTLPPPVQYTVTFDSHGGSTVGAITQNTGTSVGKPADPTWGGHTFQGWFSAASGGTKYTWPHTLTAGVTMYGRWTPVIYAIGYELNGGTNGAGNPSVYTIESPDITLAGASRDGWVFGGWFDNADFNGTALSRISKGSTDDKVFYAKWNPLPTYTVSGVISVSDGASAAGAELQLTKSDVAYGSAVSAGADGAYSIGGVPAGTYAIAVTREGYAPGTISAFTVSGDLSGKDLTLTALPDYTVSFNVNGGSTITSQTIRQGRKATEPSPVPTKANLNFGG
jgi:uncharacterized repeat protein (TIGR02543 family)